MYKYSFTFGQRVTLISYLYDLAKRQKLQTPWQVRDYDDYDSLLYLFEKILDSMDCEEKRIIVNDFASNMQKYWWTGYYSRSTYYRLKAKAMKTFIDCIHL